MLLWELVAWITIMALHVRTDYYWIKPPRELENKAFDLAYIAALAKRLNEMDIYNQAKNAYTDLCNHWNRESSAMAKQKTSINWLGGGSKYMTESLLPFETQYKMGEALAEMQSIAECAQELKEKLSMK